jgi:multiple sugar transport system permease protein
MRSALTEANPPLPHVNKITQKGVRWIDIKEGLTGCIFITPAFVIISVFGIFPIAFAAYVSLFQWRINPGKYIGLTNYTKAISNLAYVFAFWIALLLVFFFFKEFRRIIRISSEYKERPWIWFIPAGVTVVGIGQFIRFAVLLLPEILSISTKVRGQVRTQELFLKLLGEAWQTPSVQFALRTSILIIAIGIILAFLVNRFLIRSAHNSLYLLSSIQIIAYAGIAILLFWYTWSQIILAYKNAMEKGEHLDIWTQIITISAGFILLYISWFFWRSAGQRNSTVKTIFWIVASSTLAIGAWALIGELPREISAGDPGWWEGLLVTVYYSVGTVPFQLGISLLLAALLFQNIKGKSLFRLIYFLPYITPAVASAAVFKVFFSARPSAPINNLLQTLGAKPLLWLSEPEGIFQLILGNKITLPPWAVGPSLALVVVIIYNIWSYVGYDTVIFLAGLGNIPPELYEAAAIDGANRLGQFRHITLPLLSPTTYFLTLLSVIGTFKAFNHIWVLRNGAALGTMDTATIIIFTEFNRNTLYGYAAALSIVLLMVILVLTIINNRVAEKRVFYG